MNPAAKNSANTPHEETARQEFTPLDLETRPTVTTAAAAFYLRKAQQTMRIYACRENGPIRPIRVGAHLHWRTDEIRALLGVRHGQGVCK